MLNQVHHAVALSQMSYFKDLVSNRNEYQQSYQLDQLDVWESGPDQSLVAKVRNVNICYGVFRGTDGGWDDTIDQNVDPATTTYQGCKVRKSLLGGYFNSYQKEFDASIRSCMSNCAAGGAGHQCSMMLTGHSQGGAIAVGASLVYQDEFQPLVVTFGALQLAHAPCSKLDVNRQYRFINVDTETTGNWYDIAAMWTGYGATHFGKSILLDQHGLPSYLGINDNKYRVQSTLEHHFIEFYKERIKLMRQNYDSNNNNNGHLIIDGWDNGHRCAYDDECSTGRCAGKPTTFPKHCRSKLPPAESCWEDSDCQSNKCRLRSTIWACALPNGKMPDGGPCDVDSHCDSGRCEGYAPPYSCRAKLQKGKTCNEDSDCLSSKCKLSWEGRKCE